MDLRYLSLRARQLRALFLYRHNHLKLVLLMVSVQNRGTRLLVIDYQNLIPVSLLLVHLIT